MEKLFIKNRKGQRIAVLVEVVKPQKGLAFITHGLGGFKEQPHVQTYAQSFVESGYTTVLFDTTNTFGESDGNYENATVTNYYEDLEDVISWAKSQPWYNEPFILAGSSLGGMCTILYTEKYPEKVKALAPISTTVSGKLSMEAMPESEVTQWKESGWRVTPRTSKPGIKRLPWSHMENRVRYDVLPEAHKLNMPVLLAVGELDDSEPLGAQQKLYEALPGKKELHIIKGAPHTFRDPKHLAEIKNILTQWIKGLD